VNNPVKPAMDLHSGCEKLLRNCEYPGLGNFAAGISPPTHNCNNNKLFLNNCINTIIIQTGCCAKNLYFLKPDLFCNIATLKFLGYENGSVGKSEDGN
jgi:hypothetical protein